MERVTLKGWVHEVANHTVKIHPAALTVPFLCIIPGRRASLEKLKTRTEYLFILKPIQKPHGQMPRHTCSKHLQTFDTKEEKKLHATFCTLLFRKPITCTYKRNAQLCLSAFKNVSSLIIHYRVKHHIYLCGSCGQEFSTLRSLNLHTHPSSLHLNIFECNNVVSL